MGDKYIFWGWTSMLRNIIFHVWWEESNLLISTTELLRTHLPPPPVKQQPQFIYLLQAFAQFQDNENWLYFQLLLYTIW